MDQGLPAIQSRAQPEGNGLAACARSSLIGWDHPQTPIYYEKFCRSHSRYVRANAALVAHAHISHGLRILDVAAGTGRTTQAALRRLGEDGRVWCVEPFAAMRREGMRRIMDSRVQWRAQLHDTDQAFDRILCGAAIWQMIPLAATLHALASRLRPGGALCFNIPALYLLEPDAPGGGSDPSLLSLPALLAASPECAPPSQVHHPQAPVPLSRSGISACLSGAGLRADSWGFRVRITQQAYADWLKIPVTTDRLLGALAPRERALHIDSALATVDRSSWKWERWRGWTAWKN